MIFRLLLVMTVVLAACVGPEEGVLQISRQDIVLENGHVKWVITPNGLNKGFVDKGSGHNYCDGQTLRPVMELVTGNRRQGATFCRQAEANLEVGFGEAGSATVRVTPKGHYFVLELISVSSPEATGLDWVNLRLNLSENVGTVLNIARNDELGVCLLALNLQVDSHGRSSRQARLVASSRREYGFVGARVALIGCPASQIRQVIKEVVEAEGLPHSPLGGAWAQEAEEMKGSYLFAPASENNVDQWIDAARLASMTHLHLAGWYTSEGHYEVNRERYPSGLMGLRGVVKKIHAAGLKAGLHVLTGCITENDPYVGPVPDKRLAKDAIFTLAEGLTADATVVEVVEKPPDLPVQSTYWDLGSNELVIGEEIITYQGISRAQPYRFTGCVRGHRGTTAAAHDSGASVGHLLKRYGRYLPQADSTLVDEISKNIARVVNTCDVDMIYLDGAEAMSARNTDPEEPPYGWIQIYHGEDPLASYGPFWRDVAKMKLAILNRVKRPILVESSCFNHFTWHLRSRVGAWDSAHRAMKLYLDAHSRYVPYYRAELMPAHLGWQSIHPSGQDYDATWPDEVEYLAAKCLGWDTALALQVGTLPVLQRHGRWRELLTLLGNWERLRRAEYFPESAKARLRVPGDEFTLEGTDDQWQIRPVRYHGHTVRDVDGESNVWTVHNEFGEQAPRLRIQALQTARAYDSERALVLTDFSNVDEFTNRRRTEPLLLPDWDESGLFGEREGEGAPYKAGEVEARVLHELQPTEEVVDGRLAKALYSATNGSPDQFGWSCLSLPFSPPLDLRQREAVGVWVHGDGKGEVLNFQLTSREMRKLADHYVVVDFRGWRYFQLIEPEGKRYFEFPWPYPARMLLFGTAPYERIAWLNLFFTNIPPGETVACYLSSMKALPRTAAVIRNPSVTINGAVLRFPVTMGDGSYIELHDMDDCRLYTADGQIVKTIVPLGDLPSLVAGVNHLRFDSRVLEDDNPRVRVTVTAIGDPLQ